MSHYTQKQYRSQVLAAMTVYVVLMLAEWPHARSIPGLPWKIALALAPVIPVVMVIWLMAKRVMHSDELEQRLHLLALSMATGVVCALSLVVGFLCAAGVLVLDGDVLIWIAPVLFVIYGAMRWWLALRYGSTSRA
jgi:hypothetical protein